jgi:hypothetical protein
MQPRLAFVAPLYDINRITVASTQVQLSQIFDYPHITCQVPFVVDTPVNDIFICIITGMSAIPALKQQFWADKLQSV